MGHCNMIARFFSFLFFLIVSAAVSYCDINPRIQTIRSYGEINDIALDGDFIWCASTNGIIRWNTVDRSYSCFTVSDGLPSSEVTCIAVAKDGVVFAGTDSGLVFYDHDIWMTITIENGLPDNIITHINFDREGTLWIATPSALSYFKDYAWNTIECDASGSITSIAFAPDNSVWYSLDGHYIDKVGVVGLTGGKTVKYTLDDGLSHYDVNSIRFDANGVLWASCITGLSRFDGESWTSYDLHSRTLETIRDHSGRLWCATLGGLSVFENESWIAYPNGENAWLTSIALGDDGTIRAGTNRDGLYLFDGASWSALRADNAPLGNHINDITVSPKGDVWVTSGFLGVSCLKQGKWKFFTESEGIPSRFATCVKVDYYNNVWLGTSYGLSVYDGLSWDTFSGEDAPPVKNINTIETSEDGTVWVGLYGGVFSYDGESWTSYTTYDGLIDSFINVIETGPDGSLWASGLYYDPYGEKPRTWFGICRFNNGLWEAFTTESPRSTDVTALAPCADGSVWVGTSKGLYLFDGLNWEKFFSEDGLDKYSYISSLAVDREGLLWICTFYEIYTFDGSRFSMVAELSDYRYEISSIAFDEQNTAWVGTSNGILKISSLSTDVAVLTSSPAIIKIHGNYPNPFNRGTAVDFDLTSRERTNISIYNCLGQCVRTLFDGYYTAGGHTVRWDGMNDAGQELSSGVYLLLLKTGNMSAAHRMTLLK